MATAIFQTGTARVGQEAPRELVQVSPGSLAAAACFRKGLEQLEDGEAETAAACFERAIAHAPDHADAHVGLGIASAMLLRIYPALDHLEKAVRLEPDNFYAHFKLGQLYFKLRIPQKGYAELTQAADCSTSLEERRLVAQLLKEEKAREKNGVPRPWWHKQFATSAILLGALLMGALCLALVLHLR